MPELPEVETMRRGIASVCGGRIEAVERCRTRLRPITIGPSWATFRRRATGRTISAVERVGKRIVLRLDDEQRIVIEPRMTGLVLLSDPPDVGHLRLHFLLRWKSGSAGPKKLSFWDRRGLGVVRALSADEFASRLGDSTIGPDALTLDAAGLAARLATSRRDIKVALLDQKALAGIGNLYASEMLFEARIHPCRRCSDLGRGEWRRLNDAMHSVLSTAIKYEGSTLSDGTYRNALNEAGGYQAHHRVYDRAGQACLRCSRQTIQRIVQAQRSTFFCDRCQRRPRG